MGIWGKPVHFVTQSRFSSIADSLGETQSYQFWRISTKFRNGWIFSQWTRDTVQIKRQNGYAGSYQAQICFWKN